MKKEIILVVNTLSGGGAEKVAANLSLYLQEKYSISFIVNDEAHLTYPFCGTTHSLKMPEEGNRMGTAYQIKALLRRTRLLRRMKKRPDCAAVLSFSEMTNLSNVLAGCGRNKGKTIISFHNAVEKRAGAGTKFRYMTRYVFPFMIRRADCVVSCSEEIADELGMLCRFPKGKRSVIYNGLDLEHIRGLASESFTDAENRLFENHEKTLISVGRLTRQKGHWHLLRVLKQLREEGIDAGLVLLGEGEMRGELEDLTDRLGLRDCAWMPGYVENPFKYLARADAAVFPSMYEGFSCAIAEALACGAPCVSTDHLTGAREILAPDTDYRTKVTDRAEYAAAGVLVPVCPGESTAADLPLTAEEKIMAGAVRTILADRETADRYREAAVQRARELAMDRICRQWEIILTG